MSEIIIINFYIFENLYQVSVIINFYNIILVQLVLKVRKPRDGIFFQLFVWWWSEIQSIQLIFSVRIFNSCKHRFTKVLYKDLSKFLILTRLDQNNDLSDAPRPDEDFAFLGSCLDFSEMVIPFFSNKITIKSVYWSVGNVENPQVILRISSNGEDWRICWRFEIFDSGIFSGRKIWQVFFWVASDGMMKKQTQTFNF